MWPLTVALGLVIAYFILKFARAQTDTVYIPGRSYYKSGPKVSPSPLPQDEALIGVGLETRVEPSTSVMDSGSPVSMVMMSPAPMEMSPAPMEMSPAPMSMSPAPMSMSPAPSPMAMTPVPAPSPSA